LARRIYIALPDDVFFAIEKARKTPKGEIDRSEFIVSMLRKALEVCANG